MALHRLTCWLLTPFLCAAALGCDPGGSDGGGDDGEADAAIDASLPTVPYEGAITPLPEGTVVDERSFFPAPPEGTWRYRRQTAQWQDPPPVTEGGESVMMAGEGENEFVRRSIVVIDLPVDGEVTKVRQVIDETYVIEPSMELVGPKVKFKSLEIEERTIEDERFVRTVSRVFEPPYDMLIDTWKTGLIGNRLESDMTRLTEVIQVRGEAEPREIGGIVNLSVVTPSDRQVLPMEGMYRDDVFQVDVTDDFSGMISRTYWVQQGVGVVQWQYRDTNNVIYTLTESNVEVAAPPEEEMEE